MVQAPIELGQVMRRRIGGRFSVALDPRFCPCSSSINIGDWQDCMICMSALSLSSFSWNGEMAQSRWQWCPAS